MGAAGNVTIYDLEAVEAVYRRLWPDRSLYVDLSYANDPTTHEHADGQCWPSIEDCRKTEEDRRVLVAHLPNGGRLLLDYADDQGNQDGLANDYWFNADWDDLVDRPDWMSRYEAVPEKWTRPEGGGQATVERWHNKTWGSYARFHTAIHESDVWNQTVEVWT